MMAVTTFIVFAVVFSGCQGQSYPFMNTSLSFEERVKVYTKLFYNIVKFQDNDLLALIVKFILMILGSS